MTTCRDCKSWKDCPGKVRTCPNCAGKGRYDYKTCDMCGGTGQIAEGYVYGEIQWCPLQVFWILKWEEYFDIGIWPTPESIAEAPKRTLSKDAQYVNAMLIIGELRTRLEKTGLKGEKLKDECKLREKMLYLSDEAKDALWYVSGWKRRHTPFNIWASKRRYRGYKNIPNPHQSRA